MHHFLFLSQELNNVVIFIFFLQGTVRRSTDGHIIHANIDIDIIIEEEKPYGSTQKPEEIFKIMERYAAFVTITIKCLALPYIRTYVLILSMNFLV